MFLASKRKSKPKPKKKPARKSQEVSDNLPRDYYEWKQQRQQLNKYFNILPQNPNSDTSHMLLMDTTLKSGKKLVQLLHQTSDTKTKRSTKRKSDSNRSLLKAIEVKPQTKVMKVLSAFEKCSHNTVASVSAVAVDNKRRVVDEATQSDLFQNSTHNLSQDSTQDTARNRVTDQDESINKTENIELSKETTISRLPTNVDQIEAIHNNETQMVANQPEANTVHNIMLVDHPKSQCDQNQLVARQLINEPDGRSLITPWIKKNQVITTTDKMRFNIVHLQDISTSLDQNQTIINQPTPPPFLRLEINGSKVNIPPNLFVNRPTVMNFQEVPTYQLMNQSGHRVDQSKIMVAPSQRFLFTQSNQNLDQNQNLNQNYLGQNINVAQNENVNKTEIEKTPVLEVNSLKRNRPTSPAIKEPLSKICNRMCKSKDYDPNWLNNIFGDKPKQMVKEAKTSDSNCNVESVVEGGSNMPIIQNVISLSQSVTSSSDLGNNSGIVGPKLRKIASKPTGPMVKQDSVPSTSAESIQNRNLVLQNNNKEPHNIDRKTPESQLIKKIDNSKKHYKRIGTKERQDFVSKLNVIQNVENPQRSIIQHTSTYVSHQKAETKNNHTGNSKIIKETQNKRTDAIETVPKTSVINSTPATNIEKQIIRKAQNDKDRELPVLSVKSTEAINAGAGAANVHTGNCYVNIRGRSKVLI